MGHYYGKCYQDHHGFISECSPEVKNMVEVCRNLIHTMKILGEDDPMFPSMLSILERMCELLVRLVDEITNQNMNPWFQGYDGPNWADDDDFDLNRCMNEESYEVLEFLEEATPVEDVEEKLDDELEIMDEEEKPLTDPETLETKFYPTDPIWDMSDFSEVDEDDIHSWEEEFGDELVNMSIPSGEVFDPLGDLNELEALLFEEPSVGIDNDLHQEIEQSVDMALEMVEPPLYNCDSWPVRVKDSGSSSRPKVSRERARKRKDRHISRMHKSSTGDNVSLHFHRKDHSPHYMPHIRFGPGKFKYWWPDPFENFKISLNSTNICFINNKERVKLNGLDMGWIKEKPPD